ncbi:UDP-glucose 4-epimerase [Proteiniborus ethanoligenes]|uniref:UDP-glucose 4-epimerase n=1 Tax=Proteiniborus ethanoligenes TaxID=415015 RepID=A0A1H3QWA1_9FIRM|nr:UDP-glucose 4-epimerase GalE [Proteiniborus ethanoligenes]SDZ17620.1 UDP-glucose 4-epimerase [Proteiniborus ethanoligenes]
MAILITGGAGYIGSHTCIELLNAGHEVVVVDNLSNSDIEVIEKMRSITEKELMFYELDLLDECKLEGVFIENEIDIVIHFAGYKAVGESVNEPLKYYYNNIAGTLVLLELMKKHKVKKIIFSSSATVYGNTTKVPISEDFPIKPTNPYGRTKQIIEDILMDLHISDPEWSIVILRYFNPIGAHESGKIGDDPKGIPNNLMPYITQVASGKIDKLYIYGNDYDTYDGTGVRDYIHVVDLAKGHVKALERIKNFSCLDIYNLGTGKGYSVLDVITTFENTNKVKIPYVYTDRRAGDVSKSYCDPIKALKELGWKAEKNLEDMCRDSWNWCKSSK